VRQTTDAAEISSRMRGLGEFATALMDAGGNLALLGMALAGVCGAFAESVARGTGEPLESLTDVMARHIAGRTIPDGRTVQEAVIAGGGNLLPEAKR
jgi:hypothetical protein